MRRILRSKLLLSAVLVCSCFLLMTGCNKQSDDENPTTTSNNNAPRLNATYVVDTDASKLDEASDISDILYGLFLEDINFAVDAGLYAELYQCLR